MSSSDSSDSPLPEGEFDVEAIENIRVRENPQSSANQEGYIVEYLIKWKGYSDSETTWEPESNLMCDDLLKQWKPVVLRKILEWKKTEEERRETPNYKPSKRRVRRRKGAPSSQASLSQQSLQSSCHSPNSSLASQDSTPSPLKTILKKPRDENGTTEDSPTTKRVRFSLGIDDLKEEIPSNKDSIPARSNASDTHEHGTSTETKASGSISHSEFDDDTNSSDTIVSPPISPERPSEPVLSIAHSLSPTDPRKRCSQETSLSQPSTSKGMHKASTSKASVPVEELHPLERNLPVTKIMGMQTVAGEVVFLCKFRDGDKSIYDIAELCELRKVNETLVIQYLEAHKIGNVGVPNHILTNAIARQASTEQESDDDDIAW